jgi:hypothetical protein
MHQNINIFFYYRNKDMISQIPGVDMELALKARTVYEFDREIVVKVEYINSSIIISLLLCFLTLYDNTVSLQYIY